MTQVLIYQSNFDPDMWRATNWPKQNNLTEEFPSRQEAQQSYQDTYAAEGEEIRYFGPLLVTCSLSETNGQWTALAIADRPYSVSADSEADVKAAFITMWNDQYVTNNGGDPVTDDNIDWTYE